MLNSAAIHGQHPSDPADWSTFAQKRSTLIFYRAGTDPVANPDIPAALAQLQTHLEAAAATLTDNSFAVDRGILTGGRQLRYYWSGETDAPRFAERFDLNGEIVGQRFSLVASWPLANLTPALATAIDIEMELLAGQIRTRLDADSDLGNHIDNHILSFAQQDIVMIGNARFVVLEWDIDMAYVEYAIGK